jgi:hypothetical protein
MPFSGPFSQDALPANRSGRLSDEQLRRWQEIARERRMGIRRAAYLPGAIGTVLLIADGPPSKAVARRLVGAASLALIPVIIVLANHDALSADVREGRVESIEGAITKRVVRGRTLSRFYMEIGRRRLQVSRSGYDAAPDAGIVRAYYLPRSLRVVNLERLPDPALPMGPDAAQQIIAGLIGALRSRDPVAMAEARARAAALLDAIRGDVPSGAVTRLTADELYGSWANPLMTVTFGRDGVATLATLGGPLRTGRWAIDANGRLVTDASGQMEPIDAWLDRDHLTIAIDNDRIALTRVIARQIN